MQCGMGKARRQMRKKPVHHIRSWRSHLGFTQDQAATAIGMTRENLSKLERGEISFTEDSLERVAKAFKCRISDLFAPPEHVGEGEKTRNVNDLKLVLALFEIVVEALTRNDLVARELTQSLALSYEAALERGLTPQDRDELELLVATVARRLAAVSR